MVNKTSKQENCLCQMVEYYTLNYILVIVNHTYFLNDKIAMKILRIILTSMRRLFQVFSQPSKIMICHLVKFLIKGSEEVAQTLQYLRTNVWMCSSFGFSQTVGVPTIFGFLQTRESFCCIEEKMLITYHTFKAKKVLQFGHLCGWTADQLFTIHKMDLRKREIFQPPFQVLGVDSDPHCTPRSVHKSRDVIHERHLLKGFGQRAFG